MDDERLKQGRNIGSDYFDELLARIRDIRSSEKRFYQKIRDIFALAVDYDPNSEETREFFSIIQNTLHFAVSGKVTKAIADRLAIEQYDIFHQQRLKDEARQEALDDDAELKKYLEDGK